MNDNNKSLLMQYKDYVWPRNPKDISIVQILQNKESPLKESKISEFDNFLTKAKKMDTKC